MREPRGCRDDIAEGREASSALDQLRRYQPGLTEKGASDQKSLEFAFATICAGRLRQSISDRCAGVYVVTPSLTLAAGCDGPFREPVQTVARTSLPAGGTSHNPRK